MRILIVGAGAIGGYLGACLTRGGRDVTYLVRPARAAQLAGRDLQVSGVDGAFRVPARAMGLPDRMVRRLSKEDLLEHWRRS